MTNDLSYGIVSERLPKIVMRTAHCGSLENSQTCRGITLTTNGKKTLLRSPGRVTLQAVAKAAGVTIATASRSLNDVYGVHPDTRARVLQVAEILHYVPNRFARGLVTGRSNMIGLIVSDVRNSYFAEVARGVEDAALEAGRDVMLCNSDLNAARQMKAIMSLLDKRAEAIIMNSVATLSRKEQEQIVATAIPIVLLNRPEKNTTFSTVCADNEKGGRLAAECLLRYGHRSVINLTGSKQHANLARRSLGFLKAMNMRRGAKVRTIHAAHTLEGGYNAAADCFRDLQGATAMFTGNDIMAFGVLRAALEAGVKIPQDISIIGFDDVELAAVSFPPLTTIHQPKYEVGRAALAIVNGLLESGTNSPKHHVVDVRLVERSSVMAPKR
ncbi:MAG: LacI family DNA-binding transcriptional regulator [Granulicella sp.]